MGNPSIETNGVKSSEIYRLSRAEILSTVSLFIMLVGGILSFTRNANQDFSGALGASENRTRESLERLEDRITKDLERLEYRLSKRSEAIETQLQRKKDK